MSTTEFIERIYANQSGMMTTERQMPGGGEM